MTPGPNPAYGPPQFRVIFTFVKGYEANKE